jgi:esterase/lipase superfamily enzyme
MKREQVNGWFRSTSGKARRVFIYVHGFNTPFDQAVIRFAQLVHDSDANAAPILFSWPSRGNLLDYRRDFDNASYSRSDLAEMIKIATASPNVSEVVLLAHSMGSWVAMEAVQQVALAKGHVPEKFRNLILASPDLDTGIFRRQVEAMGKHRPAITVFVSQEDRALQLSRFIARGGSRLGAINVGAEDYKAQLKSIKNVTVVDVTALRSGDRINHSIYASSPQVVQLIGSRLVSGELDAEPEAFGVLSVGERIGSAARLIVASPVLVLDAATSR